GRVEAPATSSPCRLSATKRATSSSPPLHAEERAASASRQFCRDFLAHLQPHGPQARVAAGVGPFQSSTRLSLLLHRPDADAEAVEIDFFELVWGGFFEAATFEEEAEEAPHAGGLTLVVVAALVGVAFEEPAPGAALAAGVGLLL